jgi:hypothetical protein
MKVPRVVRPGDLWLNIGSNLEDLRGLLDAYQIDLTHVYEIHFDRRSMTVYQYMVDPDGLRQAENGEVARLPAAKVTYRSGLTPELIG